MTPTTRTGPVQEALESLAAQTTGISGEVAQNAPQLAQADPSQFALAVATVDGHLYSVGAADREYSIQSISKPFTYALALQDQGEQAVAEKVDVEPSGEAFNQISLNQVTRRPSNAMINAGAIAAASLVTGDSAEQRFSRVLKWYSGFAGRDLSVDEELFVAEAEAGHRNRAIAHMLREFEILETDPEEIVQQYTKQCAVSVTTEDLALMAATLANGGVQPQTGERLVQTRVVDHVLSVMTSCGMYDAAGDWITSVGMPAKSGISGGIIGVLPGQLGVAVFSPGLDDHGHSARGMEVFERMAEQFELHLMHVTRNSRTAVRESYTVAERPSPRLRSEHEQAVLNRIGGGCRIYELHGDLLFSGAESVVRRIVDQPPEVTIVDLSGVTEVAEISRTLLADLPSGVSDSGGIAAVVDPAGILKPAIGADHQMTIFQERDQALQWGEDELLRRHEGDDEPVISAPRGAEEDSAVNGAQENSLLSRMPAAARNYVIEHAEEIQYDAGQVILESGDSLSGIHILAQGEVLAEADDPDGGRMTLVTLGEGASFGELALGTDDTRRTQLRAVTEVTLKRFSAECLEQVTAEDPGLASEIWKAMTRDAYRVLDRALLLAALRR